MNKLTEIIYASMLHDIGKLFQRADNVRIKHGTYGREQLEEIQKNMETKLDKDILFSIENHHKCDLDNKKIEDDSIAYIVYEADNISSASERRDIDNELKNIYNSEVALSSVFNVVKYNEKDVVNKYNYKLMSEEKEMNFPSSNRIYTTSEYTKISNDIKNALKEYNFEKDNPNSLLYILKNTLSYVPSSTDTTQIVDISLYEHLKLTAAIASIMYQYCEEKGINNYEQRYSNGSKRNENEFLMFSLDLSGIQKFIYTISSKGAAKMLKARSFYLEIIVEHIVDEILEKLELTRANIIYNGGGHAYILLANTIRTREVLEEAEKNINEWLINNFDNELYIAFATVECCANNFNEITEKDGVTLEKIDDIFRKLAVKLSKKKKSRYTKEQLKKLLFPIDNIDSKRECKICSKSNYIEYNDELECDLCVVCNYLYNLGDKLSRLIDKEKTNGYIVISDDDNLPIKLPNINNSENKSFDIYINQDDILKLPYKRIYTINDKKFGDKFSENIDMGMYGLKGSNYEDYANKSEGIKKLAILRADVDNLGYLFKTGLKNKKYNNKLNTLSRYSMLSGNISDFFKVYINKLLSNESMQKNEYNITTKEQKGNLKIIYSGGDDLFIIGAWDEIIEIALLLDTKLKEYTLNKVKLSAGIGVFDSKYPIFKAANLVADLEALSKSYRENGVEVKNGITLFEEKEENCFSFDDFKNGVLTKIKFLEERCEFGDNEKLNNKVKISTTLSHKLLSIFKREEKDVNKRNLIQLAYILGRLVDTLKINESETLKKNFYELREFLYNLKENEIDNQKEINELLMAIKIIIYKNRKENYDE